MQAALVGVVIFMGIQYFGGQAAVSTQRLVGVLEGQRTSGDEIRLVVLNKAWRLTLSHPVLGIGTGRFESVFSEVTEQGSTQHVREYAATYTAHNTYASVMAEMGFPGLLALVVLLGFVIVRGARARASPSARAAVCAMGVVALLIFFSSALGTVLFLLLALTLGSAIEPRGGVTEKLPTSPLSTRLPSDSRAS
jgi:O-antigen ligase